MTAIKQVYAPLPINIILRQLPTMPDPCWEWTLHRESRGYGIIKAKGKNEYVHRLFYRIFVGEVLSMQVVLHKCDNPPCCNPSHLRKGTPADNIADCHEKFRHAFGEKMAAAKLTETQVVEMRVEYARGGTSQPKLAAKYGVCKSTIMYALMGTTWNHVKGPLLCPKPRQKKQ